MPVSSQNPFLSMNPPWPFVSLACGNKPLQKGPFLPKERMLFVSYPVFCQGPWHEHLTSSVNSDGREP